MVFTVSSTVQSSTTPNVNKEWETYLEIDKILTKITHLESGKISI